MDKEQLQIIISALQFELGEPERARKIENASHVFVYSPGAARLLDAVLQGDWRAAKDLVKTVISASSIDTAILEIESCHVHETLAANGGQAAMQVIQNSTEPKHAAQLGLLLFQPQPEKNDLRQSLHNKLRHMMGPQHTVPFGRLSILLRSALQFKNLEEQGKVGPDDTAMILALYAACRSQNRGPGEVIVKAYVLESVASLSSVEASAGALEDLSAICAAAPGLNLFGSESVNAVIQGIIKRALDEDPAAAIRLMRERKHMPHDLIERSFALLITGSDARKRAYPLYNYLEHYRQRRGPDLPECNSELRLGQIVEAVVNKFTTRVPTHTLFAPIEDRPTQFPNQIVQKLRFESEVWVVEFSIEGTSLAVGCANGSVTIYDVDLDVFSITRAGVMHVSNGVHRIAWHPDGTKLLVEDIEGSAVLWHINSDVRVPIMPRVAAEGSTTAGGGDMCWHPTDPDLFFRVEWDHTVSLRYTNGEDSKWWYSLGEPLLSVTPTADKKLAVLTAKTDETPQRIIVFNNYDDPMSAAEFPLPYSEEGQYTSLQCSTWDPQTLLIMGPDKAVLILDISGKRDTTVLRGPVQLESIIRPRFSGPMDKYVLCGSEEKEPAVAWVFNRFTTDIVARFQDHRDIVNSVAMYAGEKMSLIATGSDDMDVILYTSRLKHHDNELDDESDACDDDTPYDEEEAIRSLATRYLRGMH